MFDVLLKIKVVDIIPVILFLPVLTMFLVWSYYFIKVMIHEFKDLSDNEE